MYAHTHTHTHFLSLSLFPHKQIYIFIQIPKKARGILGVRNVQRRCWTHHMQAPHCLAVACVQFSHKSPRWQHRTQHSCAVFLFPTIRVPQLPFPPRCSSHRERVGTLSWARARKPQHTQPRLSRHHAVASCSGASCKHDRYSITPNIKDFETHAKTAIGLEGTHTLRNLFVYSSHQI